MRPRPLQLLLVLALASAACGGAPAGPATVEVAIDGGTETAMAISGITVRARPGDVVRITNANTGPAEDHDGGEDADGHDDHAESANVTHALVAAPADALPPIFISSPDSAIPNGGVWGPCRGGDPADAVGTCPVLPVEGPTSWNGTDYWSTGAMLPTESRDIPLAVDLADGTHRLICALHPEIVVSIVVGDEVDADPVAAPAPGPTEALVGGEPDPGAVTVAPGDDRTRLNQFWPASVEVAAGDTVTWTTGARAPHDVVLGATEPPELVHSTPAEAVAEAPVGEWDGQDLIRSGFLTTDPAGPAGATFAVQFAQRGTYQYYCRFHPLMTGTVVVS